MPAPDDLLLGQIAIQLGLVSPGQLRQLVELSKEFGRPVGAILTEQGFITLEDMQKIIELRKVSVRSDEPQPEKRREAIVLARQVVRSGVATEEAVDECLREFIIEGEHRPFEDLLLERQVITPEKAKELKALREKRVMHCPKCKLQFSVRSASGRKEIECPKCKATLTDGKLPGPPPKAPVVEFKTTIMKALSPDTKGMPAVPAAKKTQVQCIICDALFDGALDEEGRVKCPQCGSSFTPKGLDL